MPPDALQMNAEAMALCGETGVCEIDEGLSRVM